jgi:hypothetical protein
MSERHTVEVTFEGELLASHTEGAKEYRLYRTRDDALYVYWQDERGPWLETGAPEHGVSPALIASW